MCKIADCEIGYMDSKKYNITWLSILRGLTIMLVVMNHVRLLNIKTGECYEFIDSIRMVLEPVRIPTFIFISGGLLYLTRISKSWNTSSLYKDKIVRIGLPLITCTILGCLSQLVFNGFVKTPKDVDLGTFFYSFVDFNTTPWPHRWYLMTLLLMMFLYPLFVVICNKGKVWELVTFAALCLLYFFDFRQFIETDWCNIFTLNKYVPFFFFGIIAFEHKVWRFLSHSYVFLLGWTLYACLYFVVPRSAVSIFVMGLIGILSMVSTCINLSKCCPALFLSFRGYIFQIYLFGIAFQAFVELILWRKAGCPDELVYLFYLLNVLAGLYFPVLLSKAVEKIPNKWCRLLIGLK